MVASELIDDLRRGHWEKMAMCNVRPLDLWECKSFEEKLRAKLMVWEATSSVEGAKMGIKGVVYLPNSYSRYRRSLSDEFDESARDIVLAVERCLNRTKKWLKRELSDRELFDCMKVCEVLEELGQEVNKTSNEFVDKFEK